MPEKTKCCLCSYWLSGCRHSASSTHNWFHQYLRAKGKTFDEDDLYLCRGCVHQYYRLKETITNASTTETTDSSEDEDSGSDDDELTLENVIFGGSGHKRCVVCRCEVRAGMVTMPKSSRLDLLIFHWIYVPNGVRCWALLHCWFLMDLGWLCKEYYLFLERLQNQRTRVSLMQTSSVGLHHRWINLHHLDWALPCHCTAKMYENSNQLEVFRVQNCIWKQTRSISS